MVRMKEAKSKYQRKTTCLRRENRDRKETTKPTDDKPKSPPEIIAKGKGKHVSIAEQAKDIVVEPNGPSFKVSKSKFRYL